MPNGRSHANISLSTPLWRLFRKGCLDHETSASKEIERFISTQLLAWHLLPPLQKEGPDALDRADAASIVTFTSILQQAGEIFDTLCPAKKGP
jgi:hypothetical protein